MKRNERGFTLMELMVVIVIVAILAAVAVPLYVNYVKDAQRTEAKGAIGAIISAEQVYFQKNSEYLTTGLTNSELIRTSLGVDLTEAHNNWDFSVGASGVATDGFTVTALGTRAKVSAKLQVVYTHSRTDPTKGPNWNDTDAQ